MRFHFNAEHPGLYVLPRFTITIETGGTEHTMAQADIREYEARATSTGVFGRVLCSARNHYFVVDGPVQNGCPGEEVTPAEIFLAGVAACGVELVQVLARSANA